MSRQPLSWPHDFHRFGYLLIFGFVLATLSLPPQARAVDMNGSFSTWAYMRDDSVDHVRIAPQLSFTVRNLGTPARRFETSLRGFGDVRNGVAEDRTLRLWRAVLICAPATKPFEFRLGQQWLTEGVGRDNIAGAWVKYRLAKKTSATVYGGARVMNGLSVQEKNPANGYAAGIHLRSRVSDYNLGASWYYAGKGSDLLYQGAGIEASGNVLPEVRLLGRLEMNLEQSNIERAQLLARWYPAANVDLTGEFRVHTPRLFEDSYFIRFLEEASTTYVRGGVRWNFWQELFVRGGGTMLFSEAPDPLYKAQAAFGHRWLEVGYTYWASVESSEWNGFFGEIRPHLLAPVDTYAGFDFARASNIENNLRSVDESQSLYFGVMAVPAEWLTVNAQAEHVRDIFHTSDWRGLFGLTYRFETD